MKYLVSLVFSIIVIALPASISADQGLVCNRYSDDKGFVDNVYVINGKVYRVFEMKDANNIAKTLQENKELKEKVALLEASSKIQSTITREQQFHISFLENRVKEYQEQIDRSLNKKVSLINPTTSFISGVALCSVTYGYWNHSNRR